MQLPVAQREPALATAPQHFGLGEFGQSEEVAEEPPCLRLAADRHGNLHMVEGQHVAARSSPLPLGERGEEKPSATPHPSAMSGASSCFMPTV